MCDHLGIYIADRNKYSSQCTGNEKRAKFDEEKFLSWPACLLVDLVMFFWSVLLLFHIYFFKNVLVLILLKENEVDTLWLNHLKNWKSYQKHKKKNEWVYIYLIPCKSCNLTLYFSYVRVHFWKIIKISSSGYQTRTQSSLSVSKQTT